MELSQPATPRDLRALLALQMDDTTRETLKKLAGSYAQKVLTPRLSLLDILEQHRDIEVPLATYLDMLPPMRTRQYSISSSPLWNPQRVTLTVSILNSPAISGSENSFLGVASNYLDTLRPGHKAQISVRSSSGQFRLPNDVVTPIVLFCAGSGIAPMRGFIQERALQKRSGREVGKMLLFFGCRTPKDDYLYSDTDLKEWTGLGAVDVRPAFSRSLQDSEGCKYVQE